MIMKTYHLPALALKAAALCAEKKGHRERFKCVLVDETHIVGTTGGILCAIQHDCQDVTPFLIPADLVNMLVKLTVPAKDRDRCLSVDVGEDKVVIRNGHTTNYSNITIPCSSFPAWRKGIQVCSSENSSINKIAFDPALLAIAVKILKLYKANQCLELDFFKDIIKVDTTDLPQDTTLLVSMSRSKRV